jgi:hypothetical protein
MKLPHTVTVDGVYFDKGLLHTQFVTLDYHMDTCFLHAVFSAFSIWIPALQRMNKATASCFPGWMDASYLQGLAAPKPWMDTVVPPVDWTGSAWII